MMKRNLCVPVIGVCCAMFCMLLLSACSKTEPSGAGADGTRNDNSSVTVDRRVETLSSPLLGTAVPQCLVKRISGVDEDGYSEIVYSYKVNANGYVKEMKAIWSSEISPEPATETCVFEWEKYVSEKD